MDQLHTPQSMEATTNSKDKPQVTAVNHSLSQVSANNTHPTMDTVQDNATENRNIIMEKPKNTAIDKPQAVRDNFCPLPEDSLQSNSTPMVRPLDPMEKSTANNHRVVGVAQNNEAKDKPEVVRDSSGMDNQVSPSETQNDKPKDKPQVGMETPALDNHQPATETQNNKASDKSEAVMDKSATNNDKSVAETQNNKPKDKPQIESEKPAIDNHQPGTETQNNKANDKHHDKLHAPTDKQDNGHTEVNNSQDSHSLHEQQTLLERHHIKQNLKATRNRNRNKAGIFSLFGIDFVPVDIPMERRLQTLAVIYFTSCYVLFPFVFTILSVVLLFTSWWWLPVGYMIWFFYDYHICQTASRGGRRSEWLRNGPHGRYFRDYFPVTLEKTADLTPDRNYIVGTHPHGILSCGLFGNFASDATGFSTKFPGIKPHMLTLSLNLKWPLLRAYIMWVGSCEVSKESITYLMTQQGVGNAAMLVVGGAQEALFAKPGNYTLTLKTRKGFVKMALRTGASLVPAYCFGENELFDQADNPKGSLVRLFQEKFKALFGFTIPLFYGRGVFNYSFGMLPHRRPVCTIIGRPIHLEKDDNPSQDKIDTYHEIYMQGLSDVFDENKARFGVDPDAKLIFI